MTRAFCGSRGRGRWALRPVTAICALTAALLAVPTAASACPSHAKVKAFHGSGVADFAETASGTDSIGGTVSMSLDHSAFVQYPSVTPARGERHRVFIGKAGGGGKGGKVEVSDHYTDDDSPGPVTTGAQTANGPTITGHAEIGFSPSGCQYELSFSFGIATSSSGTWPNPPDEGITGTVFTPVRATPAHLKLTGSATVSLSRGGGATSAKGEYVALGLGPRNQWGNEFYDLRHASGQPLGTASIGWHFLPTFQK
jgi:hypothetical protein